jgi:MFS family permease
MHIEDMQCADTRLQGIVATAIPAITRDFNGLDYIGWYSGACFLLVGSSSALWGKLYKYLSARNVFMTALGIYLVGSIVAAAAPNGIALIVGRALQGLGCSGKWDIRSRLRWACWMTMWIFRLSQRIRPYHQLHGCSE